MTVWVYFPYLFHSLNNISLIYQGSFWKSWKKRYEFQEFQLSPGHFSIPVRDWCIANGSYRYSDIEKYLISGKAILRPLLKPLLYIPYKKNILFRPAVTENSNRKMWSISILFNFKQLSLTVQEYQTDIVHRHPSETSEDFCRTAWYYNPKNRTRNNQCKDFKSNTHWFVVSKYLFRW
jgi:hypothetical protein